MSYFLTRSPGPSNPQTLIPSYPCTLIPSYPLTPLPSLVEQMRIDFLYVVYRVLCCKKPDHYNCQENENEVILVHINRVGADNEGAPCRTKFDQTIDLLKLADNPTQDQSSHCPKK